MYCIGGNKYNLACIHALLKEKERALALLDECLATGQITKDHVLADEDWEAYREDAEFKAVINKY